MSACAKCHLSRTGHAEDAETSFMSWQPISVCLCEVPFIAHRARRGRRDTPPTSLHGAEGAVQSPCGQELHTSRRITLLSLSANPRRFHATGASTRHGMTLGHGCQGTRHGMTLGRWHFTLPTSYFLRRNDTGTVALHAAEFILPTS